MSACERCWADAAHSGDQAKAYVRLSGAMGLGRVLMEVDTGKATATMNLYHDPRHPERYVAAKSLAQAHIAFEAEALDWDSEELAAVAEWIHRVPDDDTLIEIPVTELGCGNLGALLRDKAIDGADEVSDFVGGLSVVLAGLAEEWVKVLKPGVVVRIDP